jgi:hypothetical protein
VNNTFGLFRLLFSASSVYYKPYRQVQTPIDNLQRLLRPPIFDKTRRVAFHRKLKQRNYSKCFVPEKENESAHDLGSLRAVGKTIITKGSPQTDNTKLFCLTPLHESTSLSQYPCL